jgi:hypothetical protein
LRNLPTTVEVKGTGGVVVGVLNVVVGTVTGDIVVLVVVDLGATVATPGFQESNPDGSMLWTTQ